MEISRLGPKIGILYSKQVLIGLNSWNLLYIETPTKQCLTKPYMWYIRDELTTTILDRLP